MTDDAKRKLEPPLHLDMPFGDALERFARTDPAEVESPKGKKPKVAKAAKRLASSADAERVKQPHERAPRSHR